MSTFGIEDDVVPAHVVAGGAEITRDSRVRLHPRPRGDILDLIGVRRMKNGAVGENPLVHFEAQLARDQRPWLLQEQIVHVVTVLPGNIEHVAKTLRRHQRRAGAAPLDDRVRDQRRPVNDVCEVLGGGSGVGHQVSGPSVVVNRSLRDGIGMRASSIPVAVVRNETSWVSPGSLRHSFNLGHSNGPHFTW